ncbi:5-formyltetrahydrofolate cyclo-ligase [Aquisalibacillus elongatus]|uniref:5-formyltetrahydrofolate cyclo-ligase n=1 Tax=Aquisalibacillus elongatus TaxID=485577 RepID=A0A3N5BDR5_9BACI|nr:5-formyltetrahydrofolate cyclo-ligase [Aquisalibacillus elongatus]RPF55623.1 5-formyltetrahydrofolate cyclo-ligase [Aquisalibacillus elongatus]
MYKDTFRTLVKRLLKHISPKEKEQFLVDITKHLYETEWWEQADTIGITISRNIELDTDPIIQQAWKQNKAVVIPKCYPEDDHRMEFYQYTNKHELENVFLDLYEPKKDLNKLVQPQEIDLLIVPGLLFDYDGFRIGYGGGYYDRFLENFLNHKISLAMEQQLVKHIPRDQYDLPVDAIITEKSIYTI